MCLFWCWEMHMRMKCVWLPRRNVCHEGKKRKDLSVFFFVCDLLLCIYELKKNNQPQSSQHLQECLFALHAFFPRWFWCESQCLSTWWNKTQRKIGCRLPQFIITTILFNSAATPCMLIILLIAVGNYRIKPMWPMRPMWNSALQWLCCD